MKRFMFMFRWEIYRKVLDFIRIVLKRLLQLKFQAISYEKRFNSMHG